MAVAPLIAALATGLMVFGQDQEQNQDANRNQRTVSLVAINDLTQLRTAQPETVYRVRGYHQAEDGGGGEFRYDPRSQVKEDAGTILAPAHLPGRFLRVFDPTGSVRAEWFGARGNGVGNDAPAINACLKRFSRVHLLGKTYGLRGTARWKGDQRPRHSIHLESGYQIVGSGRHSTRLRLVDGANPRRHAFHIISNANYYESAENIVLRDLTIDCNFDGQDLQATLNAVYVRGGGPILERLRIVGYGAGYHRESGRSQEAFVLRTQLVYKDATSSRRGPVIREVEFTAPGHNGDIRQQVGEITHIIVSGAQNFKNYSWILVTGKDPEHDPSNGGENENNLWMAYGGVIDRVWMHDVPYDAVRQKSTLHGFSFTNVDGLTLRENRVENFDGPVVFVMNSWNRKVHIHHNLFHNVYAGLYLSMPARKGSSLTAPHYRDLLFEHNRIQLGEPRHLDSQPRGVSITAGRFKGIRMENVSIQHNTIAGRSFLDASGRRVYPTGVKIEIPNNNYRNLVVESNTIDVPDFSRDSKIAPQRSGSLSISFYPKAHWKRNNDSGNVRLGKNLNSVQRPLRPALFEWTWKKRATFGDPKLQPALQPASKPDQQEAPAKPGSPRDRLIGPMVCHVTSSTAMLWASTPEQDRLAVHYHLATESPPNPRRLPIKVVPGTQPVVRVTLRGLTPNTSYRYEVRSNGRSQPGWSGSFKTAPITATPGRFKVAVASCMNAEAFPSQASWNLVLTEKPDLQFLLGDNVYANTFDPAKQWRYHSRQRQVPEFAAVIRQIPTYAVWDDHDFGPNDSDGTSHPFGRVQSLRTFKELFGNPFYGTPEIPGLFCNFSWGDVEFFLLDTRYHRHPNRAPDDDQKRMLGDDQFQWLISGLKASHAKFKVLAMGSTLQQSKVDGWRSYQFARRRLFQTLMEQKISGVFFVTGDVHYCALQKHRPAVPGYLLWELISSGIAYQDTYLGFATIEFDTTLPDPIARFRIIHGNGSVVQEETLRLSKLQF